MNSTFKSLTAFTLSLSLMSQFALAGNGSVEGNGGDDPTIAYNPTQIAAIQNHLNLDYLKLTPAEIAKRDQSLKPIYDYYQQATAQKVVEQIQSTFGINIYQYQATTNGLYKANLSDKVSTMDSAVRFFTGLDADQSPFSSMDPTVLPGAGSITLSQAVLNTKITTGDTSNFAPEENNPANFLIETYKESVGVDHWYGDGTAEAVFSSLPDNLFEVPVLDRFLTGLKESNLKGLDAAVVFAAGSVTVAGPADANGNATTVSLPYQVVYPAFSNLAPIPQPIVFISREASADDINGMLQTHAQKIYAYNQLFGMQVLPQANDVATELAKYPDVIASLKAANSAINEDNMKQKVYEGFLDVSFALVTAGLTAVTIHAMLASVVLRPILIAVIAR
jgi:hypothetical protein